MDADDDWANHRLLRRRASLACTKPPVSRDGFLNRSLRDFSDRIKVGAEDESKPLGSFGAEGEARTSLDSVGSDGAKEEWKQVSGGGGANV